MKKLFAILMSVIMIVAFMPSMAFAAEPNPNPNFIANQYNANSWAEHGKFKVELETPAYNNGETSLEGAKAFAEVYNDYSVYAKLDNDKVNGHSVMATVAMKNVATLGVGADGKTHKVGPIEAGLDGHFTLGEYFPNIMDFKAATLNGSVNGKKFTYNVTNFEQQENSKERVLVATPDSTEKVRAAWSELTKQVTTKNYDEDDSMIVIPAGAYRNREFAGEECEFSWKDHSEESSENFWLEKTRCGAVENETDRSETIINEAELAAREDIVFDPQTSGGLLLSIDPQDADRAISRLSSLSLPYAVIGRVINLQKKHLVFVK